MRILETGHGDLFTASAAAVRLHDVDAPARARVSGPGMRSFKEIADHWGLTETDRRVLLGAPPRSTYHHWMKLARDRRPLTLPLDTLLRISAVLGVHKALGILFSDRGAALVWLKQPHRAALFGGQAPIDLMLAGTQDGILAVRRYLDAWRGGLPGGPAPGDDVAPVTIEDLVFV